MNDNSFAIGSPMLFFSGSAVSLYLVYMIFHYIYDSLANHLIRRENLISYLISLILLINCFLLSLVWIISTSINLKINDDEDINTEITLGIFLLEFAGMFAHGWIYSHFILKKDFSFKIFSKRMMKCILVIAFIVGMQFLIIFSYHLYLLQFVKLIGSLWS